MKTATRINGSQYYEHDTGRIISRPNVAVQDAKHPLRCTLPNGMGSTITRARSLGFEIQATAQAARMTDAGMLNDAARYRSEIMALPEAQERPASAEKIADGYGFKSMPVARAASVLRGLPSEIDELAASFSERRAARAAAAVPEDPKVRRRVELHIMGLRAAIEPEARRERVALTLALNTARESRISVTAALARVGIDATRFA